MLLWLNRPRVPGRREPEAERGAPSCSLPLPEYICPQDSPQASLANSALPGCFLLDDGPLSYLPILPCSLSDTYYQACWRTQCYPSRNFSQSHQKTRSQTLNRCLHGLGAINFQIRTCLFVTEQAVPLSSCGYMQGWLCLFLRFQRSKYISETENI